MLNQKYTCMSSSYAESMCYEIFIRRAFKCDYDQHHSKNSYFQNLIDTERGANLASLIGSYDKQLKPIKKSIEKAIQEFLKLKLNETESTELTLMLQELPHLYLTREIKLFLERGLKVTEQFKE